MRTTLNRNFVETFSLTADTGILHFYFQSLELDSKNTPFHLSLVENERYESWQCVVPLAAYAAAISAGGS